MIVGGYAVNLHGYVRNTGDLDVWVAADRVNAERIVEALIHFGFDVHDVSADLFIGPNRIVQMGVEPEKIEIISSIDGITWQEAAMHVQIVQIDDTNVRVISLPDLRKNKAASGRSRDQDDLEHLPEA